MDKALQDHPVLRSVEGLHILVMQGCRRPHCLHVGSSAKEKGCQRHSHEKLFKRPFGSFLVFSLIAIRPGRVSYHDQVQVQGLNRQKGGNLLEEAPCVDFGGVVRGIKAKALVMAASSEAYS